MKAVSTKTGIRSWGAPGTTKPGAQEVFICHDCKAKTPFARLVASGPTSYGTVTYHYPECNKLLAGHYVPERWEW